MPIQGDASDRFAEVAEEFARNFAERGEVGASVSVVVDGETVVDLWGGWTDFDRTKPWEKDTLCNVMSCTKGAVALCAHLLASAGELDFDEPVAAYWPEFAAAGKERVLVRHLLNHQAGLPVVVDPVPDGGFYDWDDIVGRLAAQAPLWDPGTRHGYHALTWGFLVGEVLRRVTGVGVGEFFATEVAAPLGIDLWIGLPESEHARVAQFLPPPPPPPDEPMSRYMTEVFTQPGSVPFLVMMNNGNYLFPGAWDSPAALSAVIPASGGVGNARSLAAMYGAIIDAGRIGRFRLEPEDVARMGAVESAALEDFVLYGPGRWTLGFHKGGASPKGVVPPVRISLSEEAFGHSGFGGSMAFADPGAGFAFAYVMNQMKADMGLAESGQSLIDATYRAVGYRRERYDTWVRPRAGTTAVSGASR
jgi:CubicO group peptidase (beta-lactamase class C family)